MKFIVLYRHIADMFHNDQEYICLTQIAQAHIRSHLVEQFLKDESKIGGPSLESDSFNMLG